MSKYIKWELINEFKSKTILLGVIASVYLLAAILNPGTGFFTGCIYLGFAIIIGIAFFLTFIYGARRTMDSYKNQTFLLESMIPLSPKKLLLAKYVLAIIFDFVFCLIFIIGISIWLSKADINMLEVISRFLLNTTFEQKTIIAKTFVLIISSTIAFTSLCSLIFITLKSLFPNGKAQKIISYIICFLIQYIISYIIGKVVSQNPSINVLMIYSIVMLALSTAYFFGSAWLIENKLEVYN